jgi:DDE superfamily endonuclease
VEDEPKGQPRTGPLRRIWQDHPLGPDEYVISCDEKTSIQARCRCHPTLPLGKARGMRVNHDYDRGGALAYLAAYDVHRATVIGRCAPSTGIEPFMTLVEQVMTQAPYASAKRVFWIVDNGSSHRGKAAIDRLTQRFPNAVMVHTPVHASWLNQVEQRLAEFEQRYNATARPFRWKFTPADLDDLLAKIDQHQQPTAPNTIPQAA